MEQKEKCNLIEDLLPLYIEELVSEKTQNEIKHHLENCDKCLESFNRIKNEKNSNRTIPRTWSNLFNYNRIHPRQHRRWKIFHDYDGIWHLTWNHFLFLRRLWNRCPNGRKDCEMGMAYSAISL